MPEMNINDELQPSQTSPIKRNISRNDNKSMTSNSKFLDTRASGLNATSKQSITALWKGVSSLTASVGEKTDDPSFSPKNMVGAQIQLKMKQHEQI